jgi:hypothetical protein
MAYIAGIAVRKTENHRFHQSLFHRSRYLGFREDVWGSLREMASRFVQSLQP